MRTRSAFIRVTLVILAMASVLQAQDAPSSRKVPSAEVFGGFSYANYQIITVNTTLTSTGSSGSSVTTQSFSARMGLYGWNGSMTANVNSWLGLTTDVSGEYSNGSTSVSVPIAANCVSAGGPPVPCMQTIQFNVANPKTLTFLFGPQYTFRNGKLRPFARFLVGGSHRSQSSTETITTSLSNILVGTAVPTVASSTPNVQYSMAFGGGADYRIRPRLAWRTAADYLTGEGAGQNHFRIASGIVWQIGK